MQFGIRFLAKFRVERDGKFIKSRKFIKFHISMLGTNRLLLAREIFVALKTD